MANNDPSEKKPITLDPSDITEVPTVHRRSALASIGALIGAAIGVVVLKPEDAEACRRRTGRTDSDGGRYADGVGRGHTGLTDSDSGDESNCGRGGGGRGGAPWPRRRTPHCPAPWRGRADGSHCTDSDSGRYADGAGRGRRCR
ncbi:MAG: hypothetical protein IPF99_29885 [Deltaproteobacteria bacterium]|nr:hypothetical protein [Deltaproteobacteria bacterium]